VRQWIAAGIAAGTSALSLGLLPRPWDGIVTVAVAALSALYVDRRTLTRCPDCGTAHELMAPPSTVGASADAEP